MNLIERLGGYQAAKDIVDNMPVDYAGYRSLAYSKSHGYQLAHPFNMVPNEYYIYYIKEKLLEYRREHNIFEIGDLVVLTTMKDTHKSVEKLVNLEVCMFGDYPAFVEDECRHATDKEIEQGYRDDK